MISSTAWDGLWRLHDVGSGRQRLVTGLAGGLQFGGEDRLVAGTSDDRLGLATVATGTECRTLLCKSRGDDPIESIAAHPDGRLLAVARGRWIGFWDLSDGRLVGELSEPCRRLAFSARGDLFTHGPGGLRRWPISIGRDGSVFIARSSIIADYKPDGVMGISTSADGRVVAATFAQGLAVIDSERPRRTTWLPPQSDARTLSVSPDGRFVAAASWHGGQGVRVYEAGSGRPVARIAASEGTAVSFSPDGRWLVVGSERPRQLWKLADWSPGPVIGGVAHAFTGDGKLVATATTEGIVRLIQAETGVELAKLEPPDLERVYDLAFSADGTRLTVSCAIADWIYTWDLRTIRRQLSALDLDWEAPSLPDFEAIRPLRLIVEDPSPDPLREWVSEHIQALIEFHRGGCLADFHERRANAAIRRKSFDRALAELDHAIALGPGSPELHFERGQILLRPQRNVPAAVMAFEQAVAADPAWREPRIALASARIDSGRAAETIGNLEQLLVERPWDIAARGLKGHALQVIGRNREALIDLNSALASSPFNLRYQRWVVETNHSLGNPPQAKVAKLSNELANRLAWQLVAGHLGHRDAQMALPLALQAATSQPEVFDYRNTLALTYLRLGRYPEAIAELRESLPSRAGRLKAYDLYPLALARYRLGDHLGGWSDFIRACLWHLVHASTLDSQGRAELADFLVETLDVFFGTSASPRTTD